MDKKSKVFTESFLHNLFYRNSSFAYRYPDDLDCKMGELKEKFENAVLWNKRRDDILIGKYYVVASVTRNGIFTDVFHVKGFGDNVDEYVGDEISINNDALFMYSDTDFIIERYATVYEITSEFFNGLKNDVVEFQRIINTLDENITKIDINKNLHDTYTTFVTNKGWTPFDERLRDMTISEFNGKVEQYNRDTEKRLDKILGYCEDKLRDRYILYREDDVTCIKNIYTFNVEKIKEIYGTRHCIVSYDDIITIFKNRCDSLSCYYSKDNKSISTCFDNGQEYWLLSEDVGDSMFQCCERIKEKVIGLLLEKKLMA